MPHRPNKISITLEPESFCGWVEGEPGALRLKFKGSGYRNLLLFAFTAHVFRTEYPYVEKPSVSYLSLGDVNSPGTVLGELKRCWGQRGTPNSYSVDAVKAACSRMSPFRDSSPNFKAYDGPRPLQPAPTMANRGKEYGENIRKELESYINLFKLHTPGSDPHLIIDMPDNRPWTEKVEIHPSDFFDRAYELYRKQSQIQGSEQEDENGNEALRHYCEKLKKDLEANWWSLPSPNPLAGLPPLPIRSILTLQFGTFETKHNLPKSYNSPIEAIRAALDSPGPLTTAEQIHLPEFLEHQLCLIALLAESGAGKTVALKEIAWILADERIRTQDTKAFVPVYIDLSEVRWSNSIDEILNAHSANVRTQSEKFRVVWLLDGLDTVEEATARSIITDIYSRQPQNRERFVIASRPTLPVVSELDNRLAVRIELLPLERRRIRKWASQNCPILLDTQLEPFLATPLFLAWFSFIALAHPTGRVCPRRFHGEASLLDDLISRVLNWAVREKKLTDHEASEANSEAVWGIFWVAAFASELHPDQVPIDEAENYSRLAFPPEAAKEKYRQWKRSSRLLLKAGLIKKHEGHLVAVHKEFSDFWAARHAARRLELAWRRGWFKAELLDYFEQTRLDRLLALAICMISDVQIRNSSPTVPAPEDRHEAVYSALKDTDPSGARALIESVRNDSTIPILRSSGLRAEEDIIRDLENPDSKVRRSAVTTLGQCRTPNSVEALVGALRDQDCGVQREAAFQLGKVGGPTAIAALKAAISAGQTSTSVLHMQANSLAMLDRSGARESFLQGIRTEGNDRKVQWVFCYALAALGGREVVDGAMEILVTPNLGIDARLAATAILVRIGSERDLVSVLERRGMDPRIYWAVSVALLKANSQYGEDYLERVIKNDNEEFTKRRIAAKALGLLNSALPALIRFHSPQSRKLADRRLRTRRCVEVLRQLLNEPLDSTIRKDVLQAFLRTQGKPTDPVVMRLIKNWAEQSDMRLYAASTLVEEHACGWVDLEPAEFDIISRQVHLDRQARLLAKGLVLRIDAEDDLSNLLPLDIDRRAIEDECRSSRGVFQTIETLHEQGYRRDYVYKLHNLEAATAETLRADLAEMLCTEDSFVRWFAGGLYGRIECPERVVQRFLAHPCVPDRYVESNVLCGIETEDLPVDMLISASRDHGLDASSRFAALNAVIRSPAARVLPDLVSCFDSDDAWVWIEAAEALILVTRKQGSARALTHIIKEREALIWWVFTTVLREIPKTLVIENLVAYLARHRGAVSTTYVVGMSALEQVIRTVPGCALQYLGKKLDSPDVAERRLAVRLLGKYYSDFPDGLTIVKSLVDEDAEVRDLTAAVLAKWCLRNPDAKLAKLRRETQECKVSAAAVQGVALRLGRRVIPYSVSRSIQEEREIRSRYESRRGPV